MMQSARWGMVCVMAVVLLAGLIGCSNPNVTLANYNRIESGMNRSDVVGIMGKPDDEDAGGGSIAGFGASGTKLRWKSGGKKIIVSLVDDKVFLKLKKGF